MSIRTSKRQKQPRCELPTVIARIPTSTSLTTIHTGRALT